MNKVVQELITAFLAEQPKSNKDYITHEINGHKIEVRIEHYVEENWTEFSYKKGIQKTNHSFPIGDKEKYQPAPWVNEYYHYDLVKVNIDGKVIINNLLPINVSQPCHNPNYNPTYYLDEQALNVGIEHHVTELWTEYDYKNQKNNERTITSPIKNREDYKPNKWVKEYSFFDTVKTINKDGKMSAINQEHLNESTKYCNPNYDPVYYLDEQAKEKSNSPTVSIHAKKKKVLIPSIYVHPKKTNIAGK